MTGASPYQLDVTHDTAIITIASALEQSDIVAILHRCRSLPEHVVTLQVDLRPMGMMSDPEATVVRLILHVWRKARGGSFRLTTTHLVATCRQVVAPPAAAWSPGSQAVPFAWSMRGSRAAQAVRVPSASGGHVDQPAPLGGA